MNPYSHTYPGRKCSRHYRFPALLRRYQGIRGFPSDPAPLLPAGNSSASTRIIHKSRKPEAVTMCREITIELEMVKPNDTETNQIQNSSDVGEKHA